MGWQRAKTTHTGACCGKNSALKALAWNSHILSINKWKLIIKIIKSRQACEERLPSWGGLWGGCRATPRNTWKVRQAQAQASSGQEVLVVRERRRAESPVRGGCVDWEEAQAPGVGSQLGSSTRRSVSGESSCQYLELTHVEPKSHSLKNVKFSSPWPPFPQYELGHEWQGASPAAPWALRLHLAWRARASHPHPIPAAASTALAALPGPPAQ